MAARTRDIAGYRDAELIGQGGFSAVYRASDETHGREVAIKVLEGALGDAERRRFDRERQTMGRLGSHPNIIPVYESGYTESGEGYIVMQLATGGSLGARLRAGGPVPWPEACRIMGEIADATQVAHEGGVLHRDIKPDNILIDQYGHPKLSDFGIAAVANNATATMSTTATLAHAAPELLQGQPISTGVDIYALGSTLCALVTGLPPFVRAGDEGVTPMIARALTEPPPDLRLSGIPDAVARIVEHALVKDPGGRQASAAQMAAQLRAVGSQSGSVYPSAPTTPGGAPYAPPGVFQPTGGGGSGPLLSGFRTTGGPAGGPGPDSGPFAPPGYGAPPPPAGFHNQSAPQGFAHTTPQPAPGFGPTTPPHGSPGPGGAVVGGPAPFQAGPAGSGRDGSSRVVWLVAAALAAVGLIGVIGLVLATSGNGGGGGDGTTASTTVTGSTATGPGPGSTTGTGAGGPTVTIECPDQIELNSRIYCDIVSAGATGGEWTLPGFVEGPQELEDVPGTYQIFIAPTNGEAVGATFTISATVTDAAGVSVSATHQFTVVGAVKVSITCPAEVPLNVSTTCDIVSAGATEGEWEIPGFGGEPLQVVPGSNPVTISPNVEGAVGQTFTLTVTVRDAAGATATATHEFTVTSN